MAQITTAPACPRGESASLLPPPRRYHQLRKTVHLLCFLIFVALPFFDVMRFDIPKQRFYFAGQQLWINEFGILFFTLMFLLFAIAAASMLYGRVYCGYLCPQMIFGEAATALEKRTRKWINKHFIDWSAKTRKVVASAIFYALLAVASVFLAFVFISFFVEPRDLLRRLLSLDIVTAGGFAGAVTTLLTFLDFAFLRQKFCTTVCPYGYLQGMLVDRHTLLVTYRDGEGKNKACIECKKCVRVCHMGVDIRKSPYQIECIHCGECIEACDEVMARLKKPGLIHYSWGEHGESLHEKTQSWPRRLGLRDSKRVIVLLVLAFYASGLAIALSMRHAVQVRISPDRGVLFTQGPRGEIRNQFRLSVDNRGRQDAELLLTVEGLPQARLVGFASPLRVKAGESRLVHFQVEVESAGLAEVSRFQFRAEAQPYQTVSKHAMTFLAPQ
ncbi:MAG: 4Fe-4S binding protein [Bryobacteraceae bacterium]|nr:4Fe-4S binding protein [Bryobacteraceae bacterium]MDW8377989.1 4Fe-4S dicluster domain-containing protein [Bryobacterales bacterium]